MNIHGVPWIKLADLAFRSCSWLWYRGFVAGVPPMNHAAIIFEERNYLYTVLEY